MSLTQLNKSFECYQTLHANDLNAITGKIDEIINELNNQPSVNPENPGSETQQGTIVQKLAFKGLNPDNSGSALSVEQRQNISSPLNDGWSDNYNSVSVGPGQALFMIVAQVRKITGQLDEYLKYEGNNVWQGPFRVGATNTTSGTGADDNKYNYIYCRTDTIGSSGSFPVVNVSETNWNTLIDNIESDSNNGRYTDTDTQITWTDHPYGVTESLPYEWQVGFTLDDNNTPSDSTDDTWSRQFGPICISHWGHNGMDGDGFEYIFYLVDETNNCPDISDPNSYWGNQYSGTYKDNSGNTQSASNVGINSSAYQSDDFIPTHWYDQPQAVDNVRTKQYVSTRKRQGGQEVTNPWTAFTAPKVWNVYASDGSKATLTNDTVFVDNDISIDSLKTISRTVPQLWNGDAEITNFTVTISNSGSTYDDTIKVGYKNLSNVEQVLEWTSPNNSVDISNVNDREFYLVKQNDNKLTEGTEQIIFELSGSGKTATRVQTFEVKDFNEGQAYMLQVSPNTLGVAKSGGSSSYSFRDSTSIKVTAISSSDKNVTNEEIKSSKISGTTIQTGDLYVLVKDQSGTELNVTPTSGDSGTSLTYDLSGIASSGLVTTLKYIEVELYYKLSSSTIRVDVETVDFSIKGDDGNITDTSTLQPLIQNEIYTIISNNDNGLIDNETNTEAGLEYATENKIEVLKGTSNVTDNCTFELVDENFPTDNSDKFFKIQYKYITDNNGSETTSSYSSGFPNNKVDLSTISGTQTGIYFKLNKNINFQTIPIPTGQKTLNYYYTLDIKHNNIKIGSKTFKLTVADISEGGSFYKLIVEHDAVYYNSDGSIYSNAVPTIKVKEIQNNDTEPVDKSFKIIKNTTTTSGLTSGDLYVTLGDLYGDDSGYYSNFSGTSLPLSTTSTSGGISTTIINVPYATNGYNLTLYKYDGNDFIYQDGPERIDCIKHGSPGNSAFTSAVVKLYRRSSRKPDDIENFPTVYFDFLQNKLYNTVGGGEPISEILNKTQSWYVSKYEPAASINEQLWMITAVAYGKAENGRDAIEWSDWDNPIQVTESGDSYPNIDIVYLYQYNDSQPNTPDTTLYYKFSTEKLYTNSSCTSESNITKDSNGYDGNGNWSTNPTPRTDKDLWVTHAIATSSSDIETIPAIRWSNPVVYVNKPQELTPGEMGKMFYMMGVWDETKEYKIDDLKIPVVFYDDGETNSSGSTGHYYYLNPETENNENLKKGTIDTGNGVSKGDIPKTGKFNHDGDNSTANINVWLEANDFGLVITEGIFSEFAKLGSAVISGDFMYSSQGELQKFNISTMQIDTTKPSIGKNGALVNSKPSYIYFYPDEDNIQYVLNGMNNNYVIHSFRLYKNTVLYGYITVPTDINFFTGQGSNGQGKIQLKDVINKDNNGNPIYIDFDIISSTNTNGEIKLKVKLDINNTSDFELIYTGSSLTVSDVVKTDIRIIYYITNELSGSNDGYYTPFKPNWCVDLKTGKMIAGSGNFVVKPNGSVTAAGGNFTISSNGNVSIKGSLESGSSITGSSITGSSITGGHISGATMDIGNGKFSVDENGNIIINGNIQSQGGVQINSQVIRSNIKLLEFNSNSGNSRVTTVNIEGQNNTLVGDTIWVQDAADRSKIGAFGVYSIVLPNPAKYIGAVVDIIIGTTNIAQGSEVWLICDGTNQNSEGDEDLSINNYPFIVPSCDITGVSGSYDSRTPKQFIMMSGDSNRNQSYIYRHVKAYSIETTYAINHSQDMQYTINTETRYANWYLFTY